MATVARTAEASKTAWAIVHRLLQQTLRQDAEHDFRAVVRHIVVDWLSVWGHPCFPGAEVLLFQLARVLQALVDAKTQTGVGAAERSARALAGFRGKLAPGDLADLAPFALELLGLLFFRMLSLRQWVLGHLPITLLELRHEGDDFEAASAAPSGSLVAAERVLAADVARVRERAGVSRVGEVAAGVGAGDASLGAAGGWGSAMTREALVARELLLEFVDEGTRERREHLHARALWLALWSDEAPRFSAAERCVAENARGRGSREWTGR